MNTWTGNSAQQPVFIGGPQCINGPESQATKMIPSRFEELDKEIEKLAMIVTALRDKIGPFMKPQPEVAGTTGTGFMPSSPVADQLAGHCNRIYGTRMALEEMLNRLDF